MSILTLAGNLILLSLGAPERGEQLRVPGDRQNLVN
jgi:hypothetical protein